MAEEFGGSISLSKELAGVSGFSEFVEDFRQQVDFFKGLAELAKEAPDKRELSSEERKLELFLEAREKLFEEAIEEMDLSKAEDPGEELVKYAVFLYLHDVTEKVGEAVLDKNNRGILSLFSSWRSWASGFLSWGYFSRPMSEIMDEYLRAEPQIVALGELCDIDILGIQDVLEKYADIVADSLPMIPEELPEAPKSGRGKRKK